MFVVELKNNCPWVCFVNIAGADHSSTTDCPGGVVPPEYKPSACVPAGLPVPCALACDKSATSVQLVPSQASVNVLGDGSN